MSAGVLTLATLGPAASAAAQPAGRPPTGSPTGPKQGCVSGNNLQLPPAAESDPKTGLGVAAALGPHNSLNVYWQKPNNDWVGPHGLDNGRQNIAYSSPALGYDPQGYPFLAVVGPSNSLDVYWQDSSNPADWKGPLQIADGASDVAYSAPVIGKDAAGEPLIMIQGPSNTLYAYWENSSNQWLGPEALGGGRQNLAYSASSAGTNGNSQPVAATDGPNDSLYVYWQEQTGYWDGPLGLDNGSPGIAYSTPAETVNAVSGLPFALAIGPANSLYVYWQESNGHWQGPLGIDNGACGIAY